MGRGLCARAGLGERVADIADVGEFEAEQHRVTTGDHRHQHQAAPADRMHVVSRVNLEGSPSAIYLNGDRVTVISSVWDYGGGLGIVGPWYGSPMTKLTVLDVSDRSAPRTVQETYADGNVLTSRAVGDRVYLVLQNSWAALPSPQVISVDGVATYETQEQYLARIAGHELDLALPHFYSRPGGPGTPLVRGGVLTDPANFYQPQSPDDTSLITVLSFNVNADSPGPVGSVSIRSGKANWFSWAPRAAGTGTGTYTSGPGLYS